jgi:hypothetical protein
VSHVDRMREMSSRGAIVCLRCGPFGWSCDISDPDVSGTNVARHDSPEEAVEAAYTLWLAKLDRFFGVHA